MKRLDMVLMDSPAAPASGVVEPPAINGSPWVPWARPQTPRDPRASPTSMIGANLIDNNSGVKSIVLHYASDRGLVRVAIPFTSVGFGVQKFIPDSDMASLRVFGNFGIARLGYSDQSSGRTERGRVLYPSYPVDYDLGLPAPPTLDEPKSSNRWLMVHNKQMSVLCVFSSEGAGRKVYCMFGSLVRERDAVPVPGSPPECKAIG